MKFCSNCGNEFIETDNFCSNCGNPRIGLINEKSEKNNATETPLLHVPDDLTDDEISKYIDSQNLVDFYDGELLNQRKHGFGRLKNEVFSYEKNDWLEFIEYEGNFKNDKKDGFGVEFNSDGEKVYEGNWKDDKYHGIGKYYSNGSLYYQGSWINGTPNGEGEIYDVDTEELVYEGIVNNGLIKLNGDTYKILGTDEDDEPLNPKENDDPLGLRDKNQDDFDPLGIR